MELIKYITSGVLFICISSANAAPLTLKQQANNDFQNSKYKQANIKFRRSLKLTPEDVDLYVGIAKCEEILAHYTEAFKYARKAKKVDPTNIYPYLILGRLYGQQGKWIDARIAYQTARVIDPQNSMAMIGLGQAIQLIGDNEGANDQFKEYSNHPKNSKINRKKINSKKKKSFSKGTR